MDRKEIFDRMTKVVQPFVKNESALNSLSDDTDIMGDLQVNSSRMVDIVINMEDEFDISIEDEELTTINTLGKAVALVESKVNS